MSDSSLKILRRYEYDATDRLSGMGLVQRFYQEGHLTTEIDQQTQRTIFRHQARPLAQRQSESGVNETRMLVSDQANSLLQTLSGIHPQQFAYTAYGHHPVESGLSRLLGFNGECPDAVTGHYPLGQGNRFFNPVLMRFNSPDALGPFDKKAGINMYAYCAGDPINFTDPTGNIKFHILKTLADRHQKAATAGQILKTTKQTTQTIARPSNPTRNPMLNKLLDKPINTTPPSAPRPPTSPTDLIHLENHLRSNMARSTSGGGLSPQQVNINNFDASYDLNKLNPTFKTVATKEQLHKLKITKDTLNFSGSNDVKKYLAEEARTTLLQIKKTSVENYYLQKALREIRQ